MKLHFAAEFPNFPVYCYVMLHNERDIPMCHSHICSEIAIMILNGVCSYNFDDFLGVRWGTAQNTYHVVTSSIFSVIIMLFMHQLLITAPYLSLLIWCHARIKQFHSVVTQIYNCKGETECYGTAICQQFTGNQTLRH